MDLHEALRMCDRCAHAIEAASERTGERALDRRMWNAGRPATRREETVDRFHVESLRSVRWFDVAAARVDGRQCAGPRHALTRRFVFRKRTTPSVISRLASSASTQLATRTHLPGSRSL